MVTYDIADSRDGPKIFANTLYSYYVAPAEQSLVNTDNGHYYAVPTACKHNLLITVSAKCGLYSVELLA